MQRPACLTSSTRLPPAPPCTSSGPSPPWWCAWAPPCSSPWFGIPPTCSWVCGSHQCACHRPAPQARPALPRRLHSAKEVRQESGVQGLFHRPEGKGGFLELNSSSSFLKGALLRERSRFLCSCRTAMKLHLHFTPLCRTDLHCFVTLVLV